MSIRSFITKAGTLAIAAGAVPATLAAQNAKADFQADNAFVSQVAAANLMEVRLGQTAVSKAQTPRVKQFASKMVNDHTSMQQQWMSVARKHGVSFNARLSTEQQSEMNRIGGLTGRDFETAYIDLMVRDHQTNLNTFNTQGRSARSADTRELVERGIPVLQEHLNLATQIRNELGGQVAANQPDTQAAAGAPQPTTPWPNVKKDQPRNQPADTHAVSQQNQANAGAPGTGDIKKDKDFVINVANHHFLEKQLGELAERKASNEQVKQYARKAAKDHAEMEQAWIAMANHNGLNIQPGMGPEHRKRLTKLEKESGRTFDRDYMSMEVSQHKGYLNALLKEGKGASSSNVREIVDRQIPVEMEHFDLAKQIGGQVGADTTAQLRTTTSAK